MAQPQYHYMLDTLREVIHLGADASAYLKEEASTIGHMEMEQSHIHQLRQEFCLVDDIEALAMYLSVENYALFVGTRSLQDTKPMESQSVTAQWSNAANREVPGLVVGGASCCALQPGGLHLYSCPNFDWDHAAPGLADLWASQIGEAGSSNNGGGPTEGLIVEPLWDPVKNFFNSFTVPASGNPVDGTGTAPSGQVSFGSFAALNSPTPPQLMSRTLSANARSRPARPTGSRTASSPCSDEDPRCCQHSSTQPHLRFFPNCGQPIPLLNEPSRYIPKFELFLKLPHELRSHIYELALSNDDIIAPQLCDKQPNGRMQFHDAKQHSRQKPNHIAIARLLGVTQVSKQIREESLPCFYSANTFRITSDTPTYFAYLDYLGRFHLIRQVILNIPKLKAVFAPQMLAQMKTYMAEVKRYEASHTAPSLTAASEGKTRASSKLPAIGPYEYFVNHPRHITGGLNEMGLLICVSMLSSSTPPSELPTPLPSSSSIPSSTSHLVIPAPYPSTFTSHPILAWFSSVLHGLNISLHIVPDNPLHYHIPGSIGILWQQKYQKSTFEAKAGLGVDREMVDKRVEEMWPDLGEGKGMFWERTSYLRGSCDGMEHVWYEVKF